jgi:hypothetical protein
MRQKAWEEHRKPNLSSVVDRPPRKQGRAFMDILISWETGYFRE